MGEGLSGLGDATTGWIPKALRKQAVLLPHRQMKEVRLPMVLAHTGELRRRFMGHRGGGRRDRG